MAQRLEIVTELEGPPIVGRFYRVPCVRYWHHGRLAWWPVFGPRHDDAEHLNFEQPHYHLDRRFLPARLFSRSRWGSDRRAVRDGLHLVLRSDDTWIASHPLSEFALRHPDGRGLGPIANCGGALPAPVLRRRRCIVADVGFPGQAGPGVTPHFDRFHAAFEGRRCGRDAEGRLICPHKGMRLGSLASDRHGRVICPLHGLAIDVRSGVVVRRPRVGGDRVR